MDTFAKRLISAWNSHDFAQVAALYSDNCEGIDVGQAGTMRGIEGLRQTFSNYWSAFPDLHFEVEAAIECSDEIALFWRATGTHKGSILRIPATGRPVQILGSTHHCVADGKITRSIYIWDTAGLLRNLGLLPELGG